MSSISVMFFIYFGGTRSSGCTAATHIFFPVPTKVAERQLPSLELLMECADSALGDGVEFSPASFFSSSRSGFADKSPKCEVVGTDFSPKCEVIGTDFSPAQP
jgi:hypothetical protein